MRLGITRFAPPGRTNPGVQPHSQLPLFFTKLLACLLREKDVLAALEVQYPCPEIAAQDKRHASAPWSWLPAPSPRPQLSRFLIAFELFSLRVVSSFELNKARKTTTPLFAAYISIDTHSFAMSALLSSAQPTAEWLEDVGGNFPIHKAVLDGQMPHSHQPRQRTGKLGLTMKNQ